MWIGMDSDGRGGVEEFFLCGSSVVVKRWRWRLEVQRVMVRE